MLTAAAWAAVCFFKIYQSSDPSGGDGYFYLKQTEWLAGHFEFYHADYSFIFFPLALIYEFTGSSLLAYQIVTSFSLFAMSASLGLIFFHHSEFIRNKTVRILVSCAFSLMLAQQTVLLKLSFEFAKNGLAQAFILIGLVYFFQKSFKHASLFFFLAIITHKLAILIVGMGILFLLIERIFKHERRKTFIFFFFGGFTLLGGAVFVIYPRLSRHFLNFFDHFAFEKNLFLDSPNQLISSSMIGLLFVWLAISCVQFRKFKNPFAISLILFSLLPFFPFFSGYNIEIKYRLFLISFTFAAVLFSLAVSTIKQKGIQVLMIVSSLALLSYEGGRYNGFPWIMNWSEKITHLNELESHVSSTDELVTHHSLQFYIDYKTKIRARSMVSENRKPRFQIAFTPEFYHLNEGLSDELRQIEIISLGSTYGLFEYEDFQNLMRVYPVLSNWRNQFQVRPDFVQDY